LSVGNGCRPCKNTNDRAAVYEFQSIFGVFSHYRLGKAKKFAPDAPFSDNFPYVGLPESVSIGERIRAALTMANWKFIRLTGIDLLLPVEPKIVGVVVLVNPRADEKTKEARVFTQSGWIAEIRGGRCCLTREGAKSSRGSHRIRPWLDLYIVLGDFGV
jgi:hypothetical protein